MKKKKTFGIIEVMIACVILILICASIQFLNVVITNSILFSKQRTTAYYLAQEGVEAVRSMRDTNLLDGDEINNNPMVSEWNTFICNSINSGNPSGCIAPSLDSVYKLEYPDSDPDDNLDQRYFLTPNQDGEKIKADGTIDYTRKITFSDSNLQSTTKGSNSDLISGITDDEVAANSIKVTVTVSWNFRGQNKEIQVSEILTNWKQQL